MTPFPSQVDQLLKEFPGLLSSGNSTPYPKHGIQHVIKTMGHPVFAEARRLDPDKLKTDKKEFRIWSWQVSSPDPTAHGLIFC